MKQDKLNTPKIVTFLLLLSVISYFAQAPALRAGSPSAAGPLGIFAIMWAPGIAAIFTKLIFDRHLRGMGWRLGTIRYLSMAYAIPALACLIIYGLVWQSGLATQDLGYFSALIAKEFSLSFELPVFVAILGLASAGFALNCLAVMGEEIGWRGFLQPTLSERFSVAKASLLVGLIWAVWHFPGIIWGGYSSGGPLTYSLICFTFMLVGLSLVAGYLWQKSQSVWTAVILHASHNLFVQAIFDPMTAKGDGKTYLLTEWGAGLAIAYLLVGLAAMGLARRN